MARVGAALLALARRGVRILVGPHQPSLDAELAQAQVLVGLESDLRWCQQRHALAARVFDLSVAFTMTLSGVVVAHFVAQTSIGVAPAVALALGTALAIGLINALVVVGLGVYSFIGTLATGSLIKALITMVTNDQSITGVKLRIPVREPQRGDFENAAKFCEARRAFLGEGPFGARYGTNRNAANAFGKCVSQSN